MFAVIFVGVEKYGEYCINDCFLKPIRKIEMKKRAIKTVVICVSVLLLLAVCFFCNAFFGNPVSKLMARHNAQKYLQSEFYGTDYEIERVSYEVDNARVGQNENYDKLVLNG